MTALAHQLDRTIIDRRAAGDGLPLLHRFGALGGVVGRRARRSIAQPGGRVYIRHPGGVEVVGEVDRGRPRRRTSSSRMDSSAARPSPPGESRVTIRLEPAARGTRLHLVHEFADAGARDEHVQGWRYQLSLFANVVADEIHSRRRRRSWISGSASGPRPRRRRADETLAAIASPGVQMRDRFSCGRGRGRADSAHRRGAALHAGHAAAARRATAQHCQGTVIADWTAVGPGDAPRGQGTNVFRWGPTDRSNR